MKLLLENGARPDFEDGDGSTSLSRAVAKTVVELLESHCTPHARFADNTVPDVLVFMIGVRSVLVTKGVNPPTYPLEVSDQFVFNSACTYIALPFACRTLRIPYHPYLRVLQVGVLGTCVEHHQHAVTHCASIEYYLLTLRTNCR